MSKYRKRPVVIDAYRFVPDGGHEIANLLNWLASFGQMITGWIVDSSGIEIPTLEGTMSAQPGDWIVRGVAGEFYPVKDDIFRLTYEIVEVENEQIEA
jgi:hypothetical protein